MKKLLALLLAFCLLCAALTGCYSAKDLDLARAAGYAAGTKDAKEAVQTPIPTQPPSTPRIYTPTPAPVRTPAPTPAPTISSSFSSSGGSLVSTQEAAPEPVAVTVYITRTGEKYHSYGCQYLSKSCIPIELSSAISYGYTPCSRCNPPC